MDKIPTDISAGAALTSTKAPAETRTLRDVVYNSKRSGGNYGSLAKSQTQQTYYISHKIESDDTLQRLALKYSINIQEIKRVNKLWSDAELGLRELVYIPVTTVQLTTLRNLYPNLEIVQSLSNHQKTSITTTTDNESTSSIPSSDSSNSIQSTTATTNSSYHDYLSKIDQRIQSTKNSLQSLDIKETYTKPSSNNDNSNSSRNTDSTIANNERHKGVHHLSDNNVYVNISSSNTRDKHVSAALKRIQQEKDDFDEL